MEFIDLKAQYKMLKESIDKNITDVINSTHFISGKMVEEFEDKLARFLGINHVISCSDGTAALQLIYMAYGIGPGDAVFCPDMTFIASVEPACMLGAEAIFCDIDNKTYNICPNSLERQIKAVIKEGRLRPKAVVAVDFVGNPADYEELKLITDRYGIILIEDAAQGLGASIKGKKCGTFGDIAATSFFPTKPLGCYGDGGAVFTNDDKIAEIIKSLRVHGKGTSKYDNIRIGINSRLDTLQAGILLAKLDALDNEIDLRQKVAGRYNEALKNIMVTPYIKADDISSYAQYIIMVESMKQRDDIRTNLHADGIPTLLYYPTPMHLLPVFQGCFMGDETFSNSISYSERTLGIPFSPYLTEDDQNKVIASLVGALC
jgi:dTDP-4-amino-4,6-dideoxygalactose transaminase